ncbi:hypothetical protein TNCV_2404191 [Trichonephila clavipes]|nr:hypothetical protein TNCV_2404191 [Trichonephila clavipes]
MDLRTAWEAITIRGWTCIWAKESREWKSRNRSTFGRERSTIRQFSAESTVVNLQDYNPRILPFLAWNCGVSIQQPSIHIPRFSNISLSGEVSTSCPNKKCLSSDKQVYPTIVSRTFNAPIEACIANHPPRRYPQL